MKVTKSGAKIQHILCPSDLSERSQRALGFAACLAENLNASLTACHCAPANWFTQENRLSEERRANIRNLIQDRVSECWGESSPPIWRSHIIENSFNAARDILMLVCESDVDLIVMKARPGILSAFRFGSIIERVVEAPPHFYFEKLYRGYLGALLKSAECPVLVKQSLAIEKVREFPS